MSYLPKGYEVPKTPSDYMKFELGANKFRIVGNVVIGYMYFNTENKPVRFKEEPQEEPQDLGSGKFGKNEVKHFWAFKVYNFNTGKVELLEITQVSIMRSMESLFCDSDWGTPEGYNITVTKEVADITKYTTQPSPPTELTEELKEQINSVNIDFEEWFKSGKNIFSNVEPKAVTYEMPKAQKESDVFADGMPEEEKITGGVI